MKVCVVLEYRFAQTPDGAVWKETSYPSTFWDPYLSVFDGVRVVARLRQVERPPELGERADGEGIEFVPIPYFHGPWRYVMRAPAVWGACRRAIGTSDAVILRVPSHLANLVFPRLRRAGHPFAVEVVGDPYDVFAPGAVEHPLRPYFRWKFTRNMRRQCGSACAASYVTARTLQRRYPPAAGALSVHYSNVHLNGFVAQSARQVDSKPAWRLVTVGSLAQLYKGTDTLIDAVALCRGKGLQIELAVVGDGAYRRQLEERATAAGLAECVHFRGQLPSGEAVQAELAGADLFVLPSRTEGLPRAMIEAMASALPCIGTSVGGIPELLPAEDLVPADDATALAAKMGEVLGDCRRMTEMSGRNLKRASDFREEVAAERRMTLYTHLRATTAAWCTEKHRHEAGLVWSDRGAVGEGRKQGNMV